MENASKALIMAGGVLIGVLILSLAVYLFIDFGTTTAEINKQNDLKQITEFNTKFTCYQDKKYDGNITIYDIITLAGYAKENNEYYKDINEELINVFIESKDVTVDDEQILIKNYGYINNSLLKYSVSNDQNAIEYNNRGKITKITFKKDN